jgi:hypothetical protein
MSFFRTRLPASAHAYPTCRTRPPMPQQPLPPEDERPRGCGWFDSSHELQQGLLVWEGMIVVDNQALPAA